MRAALTTEHAHDTHTISTPIAEQALSLRRRGVSPSGASVLRARRLRSLLIVGLAALMWPAAAIHAESAGDQTPAPTVTEGEDLSLDVNLNAPHPQAAPAPRQAAVDLGAPDYAHVSVRAVGVVNQDGAQIVRRLGADGIQVLFTCAHGQNLGVAGQIGDWYCVVMADNSLGCILAERVDLIWQRPMPDFDPGATGDDHSGLNPGERGNGGRSGRHGSTLSLPLPGGFSSLAPFGGANRVIDSAMRYLGVPYRWGGNTSVGIDCSGLVKAVFAQAGVELPRTAREQSLVGTPVDYADIQAGDRLSFACHGPTVDHTGIYIGSGQFIHASGSKGQVCIGRLDGVYLRWLVAIHRDR